MGSIFKKLKGINISLPNGQNGKNMKKNVPFYMQFVPGFVQEVVTSHSSLMGKNRDQLVNTIIAMPHITDDLKPRRSHYEEDRRYIPLLRGFVDVPAKGDPVLLCTFGGKNYYLGPLNTQNDVNFNEDPMMTPESDFNPGGGTPNTSPAGGVLSHGQSPNFIKSKRRRMMKTYMQSLDGTLAFNETHGDMMFEGRHGNSIRIGSRKEEPYIIISNYRHPKNIMESLVDGSTIGIFPLGHTIMSHMLSHIKHTDDDINNSIIEDRFIIASDSIEEPNRLMEGLIKSTMGEEAPDDIFNTYYGNQIFIQSDRLLFNTKSDDIFLSSVKDIHMGTGRHLTISANEDMIIESQRTFLGDPQKGGESREFEPMVFGNVLKEILTDLLSAIKGAQGICNGAPIPLADDTGAPGTLMSKIVPIENKLEKLLSSYHFIEPNDPK
tara:strand:+ start:852 stop:2159 length:1308 start_codon:yes stop_codon:yes gene_type:complete